MNPDIEESIRKYYKYKSSYQNKLDDQKQNVKKNELLSRKDKRTRIMNIEAESKCFNCGKIGGNIFKNDMGILSVTCGSVTPCNVANKYSVNVGQYKNIRNIQDEFVSTLNTLKTTMITIKLDYLFNYTDENSTLTMFSELKERIKVATKQLHDAKIMYYNQTDEKGKKEQLEQIEKTVLEEIDNIQTTGKEYLLNDKNDQSFITSMVERYCELNKINETKRELKYMRNVVERVKDKMDAFLLQEPITYETMFVRTTNPRPEE
tara:strand:+ start:2401 stop:3189 length:789 start_codon:yes stop_codon:yes gene_type:complete